MSANQIDLSTVSPLCAQQLSELADKHGPNALLRFDTQGAARSFMQEQRVQGWEPYGLRKDDVSWYHIRPAHVVHRAPRTDAPSAPRKQAEGGKPTAKSICLSVYVDGMARDEFVALATAAGVKEVTAKTMFSDIKAGRIR